MTVPFDIDQPGWGSSLEYADGDRGLIWPSWVVIHWGGSTREIVGVDAEKYRLRAWQRYHLSRGWRDIAYNYAVGDSGTIYRCRGLNPGGHCESSDDDPDGIPYNLSSIGVVWIGGANANGGVPSDAALAAFAQIINSTAWTPKGHKTVKIENDSSTVCPGNPLLDWIAEESWIGYDEGDEMQLSDAEWFATLRDQDIDRLAALGVISSDEAAYFKGPSVAEEDKTNLRKADHVRRPLYT